MSKYIGLLREEFDEENEWRVGYNPSDNLEKMKKWQKEHLECFNIIECKIFELKEVEGE